MKKHYIINRLKKIRITHENVRSIFAYFTLIGFVFGLMWTFIFYEPIVNYIYIDISYINNGALESYYYNLVHSILLSSCSVIAVLFSIKHETQKNIKPIFYLFLPFISYLFYSGSIILRIIYLKYKYTKMLRLGEQIKNVNFHTQGFLLFGILGVVISYFAIKIIFYKNFKSTN